MTVAITISLLLVDGATMPNETTAHMRRSPHHAPAG
jgi:hypothetical protein